MKANKQACMVAVVNSKGGVGKSTLAVHLASWLYGRGRPVTFLDADVQGSSVAWLKEAEPKIPVQHLHTAADIMRRGPALKAAAGDSVLGGLVVVADGPAGLAAETRALLVVADVALVPCGASALDLRAAALAVEVVKDAEKVRTGGRLKAFLVLNRLQANTRLGAEAVEAAKGLGIKVALPAIGLRTCLADAAGQGSVVFRMGAAARPAAEELNALFEGLSL